MRDLSKLKSALKRTAADGLAGGAARPVDSVEAGIAHIIDAVDTTLMGRRITIRIGDGQELHLDAAGRRLMRFAAPVPGQVPFDPTVELKAEDAADVANVLRALFVPPTHVTITAKPTADAFDPTEGGLTPAKLREAAGLQPNQAHDREADLNMEPFVNGLQEKCLAALWIQEEDVALLAGEEARAAALSQWAAPMMERLLSPEFPLAAALETDGIAVFVLPDAADRHAIVAGRLGAYLVAEIAGADPSETLALWHASRNSG
ncbi:MAG: hypothetical protein AAGA70_07510 [Pseudomonadota bacterium]